jgi:hypothetical protein
VTIGAPASYRRGMKPTLIALLAAVAVTTAAAGCGGSRGARPPTVSTSRATYPQESSRSPIVVPLSRKALAGVKLPSLPRFLSPTRLVIYTWGSGSCPAVPDSLVILSSHSIGIHLVMGSWRGRTPVTKRPSPHHGCTTDLSSTTMAVAVDPRQIDVHRRLTIHFYYYDSQKPVTRTAPPL